MRAAEVLLPDSLIPTGRVAALHGAWDTGLRSSSTPSAVLPQVDIVTSPHTSPKVVVAVQDFAT